MGRGSVSQAEALDSIWLYLVRLLSFIALASKNMNISGAFLPASVHVYGIAPTPAHFVY